MPIWCFDLDLVRGVVTLDVRVPTTAGMNVFSFASARREPLPSRFSSAVALIAYAAGAHDVNSAAHDRRRLEHALGRATDAIVKECGGTVSAQFWSTPGNPIEADS